MAKCNELVKRVITDNGVTEYSNVSVQQSGDAAVTLRFSTVTDYQAAALIALAKNLGIKV